MTAYVLAQIEVTEPEAYKRYTERTPAAVAAYGGRFVVRGGNPEILEGKLPGSRVVLIAFPDRAAAESFYRSPEYQAILPIRTGASKGALCIVDGVD